MLAGGKWRRTLRSREAYTLAKTKRRGRNEFGLLRPLLTSYVFPEWCEMAGIERFRVIFVKPLDPLLRSGPQVRILLGVSPESPSQAKAC